MKKPFKISEIDFDKLLYSDPVRRNVKKNIMFRYSYNNEQTQFLIQTPELVCIEKPKLINNIYEISLELRSKSQKKVNNFISFINKLDTKIIDLSNSNESWFDGNNGIYHKIIRDDPNYKNGILKLKIKNTNNFDKLLKVSKDGQKQKSSIDKIAANSKVKVVLDVFGLWIKPGKESSNYFGIYLKPLLIDFKEDIEEEISFIEDSDSDNINDVLDTEIEAKNEDDLEDNTETSLLKMADTVNNTFNDVETSLQQMTDTVNLENNNNFTDDKILLEEMTNDIKNTKQITLTLDIDRFAEASEINDTVNKKLNESLSSDDSNNLNNLLEDNLSSDSEGNNEDNIIAEFNNNTSSSENIINA
jgi:hypothetical protein